MNPVGRSLDWWNQFAHLPVLRRSSTLEQRLLSAARHPSFTSALAIRLVNGLPWRALRNIWDASSRALADAHHAQTRFAIITLREAVLDEMETSHPVRFGAWFAGQLPDHESVDQLSWTRRRTVPRRR